MNTPNWHYDEMKQIGMDFDDPAVVATYDARQQSDLEADRKEVSNWGIKAGHLVIEYGPGTGSFVLAAAQQDVYLVGGVTYFFHADPASIPYSLNIDGGTISVFIGPTNITSCSFGSFSSISPKYSSLSTNFTPTSSGIQTLSIHFSRGFGYGGVGNTPTDVIDNISLSPVRIPLQFQPLGNAVILSWTNPAYALQTAPSPTGTFSNISAAASSFTNTVSGSSGFFRLIAN